MASATSRTFSILPLFLHSRSSSSFHFFHRLAFRSISSYSPHLFIFSPPISNPFSPHFRKSHQSPLHSQSLKSEGRENPNYSPESSHGGSNSWPEWLEFNDWVDSSGYDGGEFVEEVNAEFSRVSCGWMSFSRDYPDLLWTLSREDIQAVVDNVSPFLFKDAFNTTRRMKSFLSSGLNDVPECDKPTTIDLMRFLLSYVHMAIVSSDKKPMINRVESSVRKLFGELAKSRRFYADSNASAQNQFSERYMQSSSFVQKSIEMKPGDWICPRCSFMNFARNSACRECEEPRPRKRLTGGEWECPECNFFNFGRNAVCLRCDCKKTGQNPSQNLTPALAVAAQNSSVKGQTVDKQESSNRLENPSNLGSNDHQTTGVDINLEISQYLDRVLDGRSKNDTSDIEDNLDENPTSRIEVNKDTNQAEKSQEWFNKVTELHNGEDLTNTTSDEDFPDMMPMRKGEDRFVVRKKKDRSLTSPMYKRRMAMEQQSGNSNKYVPFVPFPTGYFGSSSSDTSSTSNQQFGAISSNSGMEDNTTTNAVDNSSSNSTMEQPRKSSDSSQQFGARSSNSGMQDNNSPNSMEQPRKSADSRQQFGAITSNSVMQDKTTNTNTVVDNNSSNSSTMEQPRKSSDLSSSSSGKNPVVDSSGWRGISLEGSAVREPDPLDMSEEAKAERWFRRVAQIKDISELSQIPDEDFPSIMPMRKGVNRFVVSKRKTPLERRLTSSQYRRNPPVVRNSETVNKENDSE